MPINYQQKKNTNTVFGGTDAIVVPIGNSDQRSGTELGQLRYNTTTGLAEFYTATGWAGVDAPPTVSNISGTINEDTDSTITITGTGFKTGSIVYITGAAVTNVERSLTTTYVNQTSLTAVTNATAVNYVGGASFGVKVLNPSGLSGQLDNAGNVDRDPIFSTSAGNLGTIYDSARTRSFTISASDPDGQTVTFSIASGSLPTGLSLNSSTGVISGTANAVGSDTTFTFVIRASSTVGSLTSTEDRSFNIIVKAVVVQSFTATGSSTFSVPVGVTSVDVLVVAGGGGGGSQNGSVGGTGTDGGGGGGAGGMIDRPGLPVTPGGSISVTVGSGGAGSTGPGQAPGSQGSNSVFGSLTAIGGGFGGCGPATPNPGGPGGSGGGGGGGGGSSDPSNPSATQPSQPGDSGTFGFGSSGGAVIQGGVNANYAGGGGGGAGGGGQPAGKSPASSGGGDGGAGRASSITGSPVLYAGGGGGGGCGQPVGQPGGQAGPGGGGRSGSRGGPGTRQGTTNRGGGGCGGDGFGSSGPGGGFDGGTGAVGGPGIVIVRY
jgi:Putative Ig domain